MRESDRSNASYDSQGPPPSIPQLASVNAIYTIPQMNMSAAFPIQMNPSVWRKQSQAGLSENPYQKVFIASFEEFEASLKQVGWVTGIAVIFGLIGFSAGHSHTALLLTIISICLCFNWLFGFIFSYRTRKDLANLNFRNLNGSLNFEALMGFAQLQILILVGTFIFAFSKFTSVIIEIRELSLLADKTEEWELTFGSRSSG